MEINFDFGAWFKTDDLKNELAAMREDLRNKRVHYADKKSQLDAATGTLNTLNEKTEYLVAQTEEIEVLTTPPAKSEAETDSDALDRRFRDPVFLASSGLMIGGGAVALGGPGLKLLGRLPKLGKATKLANANKFTKLLKLGKGAAAIGAAIAIFEVAFTMIAAQDINKQLRKDKKKLAALIKEFNQEMAELESATKEAEDHLAGLFEEAGLAGLPQKEAVARYLAMLNEAIATLAERKGKIRVARRMLMLQQVPLDAISAITELDPVVVESVAKRVEVERALAEGKSVVEIARDSTLDDSQIIEIGKTVEARNEAVAGENAEAVARLIEIPVAVVLSEVEETLPLLGPSWAQIERNEDLGALAPRVLVSGDALSRLSVELRAKAALSGGDGPAAVAEAFDRPLERVGQWATDLAEARSEIAILRRDGTLGTLATAAARLRLPISAAA